VDAVGATCIASGDAARRLLDAALDRGALACAAQALGVAEQLLDLAVAYAKQREQFGARLVRSRRSSTSSPT